MPAMSSASVAVTRAETLPDPRGRRGSSAAAPRTSRSRRHERDHRERREGEPPVEEEQDAVVPTSGNVFCTSRRHALRHELVERLDVVRQPADDHAGAVALVVPEREVPEMPEEPVPESARTRSPVQPVKYVWTAALPRVGEPDGDEGRDDPAEPLQVVRPMASSITSSQRGARAVAVAASSEKPSASDERVLYGGAAREGREPRRVRARTSRRTSSRAPPMRWGPGCQTLMHSSAPRSPGLDALRELTLEQAVLVDVAVDGARLDQLVVRAARDDAAVRRARRLVGERDRRQPVGDDDRRPLPHHLAEAEPDLASVVASTEAVASSRMRMRGSMASARAIATRWRWPPGERDAALADHGLVAVRAAPR